MIDLGDELNDYTGELPLRNRPSDYPASYSLADLQNMRASVSDIRDMTSIPLRELQAQGFNRTPPFGWTEEQVQVHIRHRAQIDRIASTVDRLGFSGPSPASTWQLPDGPLDITPWVDVLDPGSWRTHYVDQVKAITVTDGTGRTTWSGFAANTRDDFKTSSDTEPDDVKLDEMHPVNRAARRAEDRKKRRNE